MKSNVHVPVLLKESIDLLDIQSNGIYVDCTSGRGGHSSAILNKLSSKGKLICIDTDEEAVAFLDQKFSKDKNVTVLKGNFKDITSLLASVNIYAVDGLIADLGVSSPMFDNPIRGFSYHDEAKLDMRMDQTQELDAEYIINNYSEKQLIKIFKEFGEVNIPNNVVKNIIRERTTHHISSTKELVDIIKKSLS
jgi:16S rRNA (cytosine1402-N4)-methyltransferase